MALGWAPVTETSMDMEWMLYGEKTLAARENEASAAADQPVFVAGLARSGSTLLLDILHQTGEFCSLTYRDMPFVLAPNLNAAWFGHKSAGPPRQRAHQDGMTITEDSPEALEEVFWRVRCGKDYIREHHLRNMYADSDTIDAFRRYIDTIRYRYGHTGAGYVSQRYLSKNNNNLLRLSSLREAFPEGHIIIPFREPLSQAQSLWRQHGHFADLQRSNPFVREYMGWLVHHEFGVDHRPMTMAAELILGCDPGQLDYWVALWVGVYEAVLEEALTNQVNPVFLCHESLRENPRHVVHSLYDTLGVSTHYYPEIAIKAPETDIDVPPPDGNASLMNRAKTVYSALKEQSGP